MFESATFKLTMWYLAIVMVISLGFSVAIYHFGTNEVSFGLQHQTQRIFNRYPIFDHDPSLRPVNDDVQQASHHLLLELIYFNALVLAGAGMASYFLARHTLEPIQAAHERQKRFTADVSHELRTPLTSLKMTSEVALMDNTAAPTELRNALTSNLEDAAKMDLLINNLLGLTRLDDVAAADNLETISIETVMQTAIEQVSAAAHAKSIRLEPSGGSFTLQADADALTQLLVILLDNAIKYSPADSSIQVATDHTATEASFTITDHGPGIAPQDLPHVFDRFYRADAARSKGHTEGYGLGLSIAKMIAERHHGSITLTSRVGKGTTATVLVPQRQQTDVVGDGEQQWHEDRKQR